MEILQELQEKGIVVDGVYFRREFIYLEIPKRVDSIVLSVGKSSREFVVEEPIENCTDGLALMIAHNTNSKVVHKIMTEEQSGTVEIFDKSLLTKELLQNIADCINKKLDIDLPKAVKFNYQIKIIKL